MIRNRLLSTISVLVFAAATVCAGDASERVQLDGVVAYVNKHVITLGDLEMIAGPAQRKLVASYRGDELATRLELLYREALDSLIDRFVILDAYEDQEKIQITGETVEDRVATMSREMFGNDRAKLAEALKNDKLTPDEWREQVREQLIISAMRAVFVDAHVRLSPKAAWNHYMANRDRYVEPLRIKLSMITVRTDESGKAHERIETARRDILAGKDFAEVAREVSEDARAAKGGNWDWVQPSMLRPELREQAENLKQGEISSIVTAGDVFYLFRVDEREGGEPIPFDDAFSSISRQLSSEDGLRLQDAWLKRLRSSAYVKIVQAELASAR